MHEARKTFENNVSTSDSESSEEEWNPCPTSLKVFIVATIGFTLLGMVSASFGICELTDHSLLKVAGLDWQCTLLTKILATSLGCFSVGVGGCILTFTTVSRIHKNIIKT